ncbi:MAG: molybdopterin molybdotransferase MoeA [Candidatus Bathyarchaeia archaeon]
MKGFKTLTRADEALKKFFEALSLKRLEAEEVEVTKALNRVLAEDLLAPIDVPGFDRAAMDGYAVRASDTFGSSQENPAILKVVERIQVGEVPSLEIGSGEAAEVATGAPIPKGANAVVMVEYTRRLEEDLLEVWQPVTPWENVSRRGEDAKRGEILLRAGTRLKPHDLGMLAALGLTKIRVVRHPRIAILSTGSELLEPGSPIEEGSPRIVDVDKLILSAEVEELGGTPLDLGTVPDDLETIEKRIAEGLRVADALIVTGGTSVGNKDLVPEAIGRLEPSGMLVHGVALRPGKPTGLAVVRGKPVLSLSGFPVAAWVGFYVFARPLILSLLGTKEEVPPKVKARMTRRVASVPGLKVFLRVIVRREGRQREKEYEGSGQLLAEPLRTSGSGILSSLLKSNGLVIIPEEKEGIEAGEEVEVILLRPIEEIHTKEA